MNPNLEPRRSLTTMATSSETVDPATPLTPAPFARLLCYSIEAMIASENMAVQMRKGSHSQLRRVEQHKAPEVPDLQSSDTTGSLAPMPAAPENKNAYILDYAFAPAVPKLGWIVGTGTADPRENKGVDFMIASEDDPISSSLRSPMFSLHIHEHTNYLLIRPVNQDIKIMVHGKTKNMLYRNRTMYVLFQPETLISVQVGLHRLDYLVQYKTTSDTKEKEGLAVARGAFFRKHLGKEPPSDAWPVNPSFTTHIIKDDLDKTRGEYMILTKWADAAFGITCRAINLRNGRPVLITELTLGDVDLQDVLEKVKKFSNIAPVSSV